MNLDDLRRPFPVERIHWRVGATNKDKTSGIALAYLDARDVMERFDEVCGMGNWQARYPWSDGQKLCCEIGVFIENRHLKEWVWKSNGAGDTNVEADKGAFSDAFKRAAVLWGVGQYLYSFPNNWYEVSNKKFTKNAIAKMNEDLRAWQTEKFGSSLRADLHKSMVAILEGLEEEDVMKVRETVDELTIDERSAVWMEFNTRQKAGIREFLQQGAKAQQESNNE